MHLQKPTASITNSQVGLFCLPYRKIKILNQVPLSVPTLSTTGHEVTQHYKKPAGLIKLQQEEKAFYRLCHFAY